MGSSASSASCQLERRLKTHCSPWLSCHTELCAHDHFKITVFASRYEEFVFLGVCCGVAYGIVTATGTRNNTVFQLPRDTHDFQVADWTQEAGPSLIGASDVVELLQPHEYA